MFIRGIIMIVLKISLTTTKGVINQRMVKINTIIIVINNNNNNKLTAPPIITLCPQPSAHCHPSINPTAIVYKVANRWHSDHHKYNCYTT